MKKLFLLLSAAVVLGACKKNSEPLPASRTDLLTTPKWKLSTVTATVSGIPVPTSFFLADCDKDNTYKFNTDKTLVEDAGAVKCSTSDPQTETGSWDFNNSDQTQLKLSVPNSALNGTLDIKELTSSTLHVTGAQSGYTVDATFTN